MTTPSAPRISEDELVRLEELAGKATPGPWRESTGRYGLPAFDRASPGRMWSSIGNQWTPTYGAHALVASWPDSAYIAALSPDVVLRLIAAARSAPAAGLDVERLAKAIFLYRTSSNVPLPSGFWERQGVGVRETFLAEATALVAALREPKP